MHTQAPSASPRCSLACSELPLQNSFVSVGGHLCDVGDLGGPGQADASMSRQVIKREGMGMAVGSRAHLEKDAIAKRTAYRNFLMRGFHLLVVAVAGGAVRDTQCGFKVGFYTFPSEACGRLCSGSHPAHLGCQWDGLGRSECTVACASVGGRGVAVYKLLTCSSKSRQVLSAGARFRAHLTCQA
jgi:hypothetical protein